MLLLSYVLVPQHDAGLDWIPTELMHRLLLPRGGAKRFAINRHLRVIDLPGWGCQRLGSSPQRL